MRTAVTLFACILAACGSADRKSPGSAPTAATEPKITQFYARNPAISTGETALICYGVENAKSVWIEPGGGGSRQELSPALSRCVEMQPTGRTTYTLTAEGTDGKQVKQDVTIGVGPPKVKILNVNVSSVEVSPGDTVTVCYTTANAQAVTIDPPGYKGGAAAKGCATHRPARTTTYKIAASGAAGDRDEESVTVRVR
jgi:hypothetical protein